MIRPLRRAAVAGLMVAAAVFLRCGDEPVQPPADTARPAIRILEPSAGAVLGASPLVRLEASDDHELARVEVVVHPVSVGGNVESDSVVATSGPLSPPYTYTWNTDPVVNGPYAIHATATDGAGNTATDSIRVALQRDREPPVVTIVSPGANAIVSGIVRISVEAADVSPVDSVVVSVYDSLGSTLTQSGFDAPPYTLEWDTRVIPLGIYRICAVGRDSLGFGSAEVCHTVKSFPPRRLTYDDDAIDEQRGVTSSTYQVANLFQNPFDVPVYVDSIECVIGGSTIPGAPFRFVVWSTSGRMPTTPMATSPDLNARSGQHVALYTTLNPIIPPHGFFAAGIQQAGTRLLAIGVDTSTFFITNTFWLAQPSGSTNWVPLEALNDFVKPMIRVTVSAVNTSANAEATGSLAARYVALPRVAESPSVPYLDWPAVSKP
jgi:hypothetical protein